MSGMRDALIAAREWIADERAAFVADATFELPDGQPDMSTIDDLSESALRDFDDILQTIDAALSADSFDNPEHGSLTQQQPFKGATQ